MASFYGWTNEYIEKMAYSDAVEYYGAIAVIEGQEALLKMKIADYPRMKDEDRRKFFRDIRKQAFPQGLQKEMDFDDFFKVMGHGGSN